MTTADGRDKFENELIVTGAVFMALSMANSFDVDVIADDVGPTTSLWARLPFMKSRYRVTITMDPEAHDGD